MKPSPLPCCYISGEYESRQEQVDLAGITAASLTTFSLDVAPCGHLIVGKDQRPALRKYVKAHFLPMGNTWVNPSLIEEFSIPSALAQTIRFLDQTVLGVQASHLQIHKLIAQARLLQTDRYRFTNLDAAVLYHPKLGMGWISTETFQVEMSLREPCRQALYSRGWVQLSSGYMAHLDQVRAIVQGLVIYSGHVCHPLAFLRKVDRDVLMARPWKVLNPHCRIVLAEVKCTGKATRGPGQGAVCMTYNVQLEMPMKDVVRVSRAIQ
jgi:hypothetical protein